LKQQGLTFLSEPFAIATGRAVEFEDPFGNKLGMTDYSASR
ncbi:MAG: VOC family protein, partial [Halobacteriota archaeon]